MDHTLAAELALIILCVILSAFFSAAETAYNTLNRVRIKNMATGGNKRAAQTLRIADNYDNLLSTILIGNNVVNIFASSLATIFFTYLLGKNGVSVSTAVMTVVVLIFGEITPKWLAKQYADQYAMSVAPALHALIILFTPLNWIFSLWKRLLTHLFKHPDNAKMTQDDLMTIVDEAQSDGGIDERNGDLIRSAIEFNDLDAGDILTPRVDVIAIDKDASLDEITDLFIHNSFSRIPVFEGSIDNIIGMIHEKDFFRGLHTGMTSIEGIIQKIIYIGTGVHISDLLHELQQSQTHMAVVVDEFGGTEGIITMEDIVEELVGEIWDEHDHVIQYFRKVGKQRYAVNCSADLDDFFTFFRIPLNAEDFDYMTVSGWVMEQLGKIPAVGDTFQYHNYTISVTKTSARHAVQIVLQSRQPVQPND
ncbi:MAG: hemolysin family protein [Oscillospiraceae bacterium]|jgi:CBS domain containing-hemolysin-like protein|nr:hemolysin family protein [Oscillospiraceae bacterium]